MPPPVFVFGGAITDVAVASGILEDRSPSGLRDAKKAAWFSKKNDLWTQIDYAISPYLIASKSDKRVANKVRCCARAPQRRRVGGAHGACSAWRACAASDLA